MEALLQYMFDQPMAINAFDSNGYMLKVNLFVSECSEYQNRHSLKEKLKEDPGFYARCAAILGPNQPGITQNDPSYTGAQDHGGGHHLPTASKKKQEQPKPPAAPEVPRPKGENPKLDDARREAEKIAKQLEETLGIDLPDLPATPALPGLPPAPAVPPAPGSAQAQELLDYLLAP